MLANLLWCLLLAWVVRVSVFLRQRGEFASVDALALVQIMIVVAVGFVLLLATQKTVKAITAAMDCPVRFLYLYYVVCLLSLCWSSLPHYSFYRAVEFSILLTGTLVALSYAREFRGAERQVLIVALATAILGTASAARYAASKGLFNLAAWHTNSYSAAAAMLFCYCVGEYFGADEARRRRLLAFGLPAGCMLALGTSSGSNVATVVAVLAIAYVRRSGKLLIGVLAISLAAAPILYLIDWRPEDLQAILFPGKSEDQVAHLGGRLHFWPMLIEQFLENPVVGQGFGVIGRGGGRVLKAQPHNSLLSAALSTGIIGLSLAVWFSAAMGLALLRACRRLRPGAVGCTAAFVAGIMNSMTNPFIFDQWEESSQVMACFLGLATLFVINKRTSAGAFRTPFDARCAPARAKKAFP